MFLVNKKNVQSPIAPIGLSPTRERQLLKGATAKNYRIYNSIINIKSIIFLLSSRGARGILVEEGRLPPNSHNFYSRHHKYRGGGEEFL